MQSKVMKFAIFNFPALNFLVHKIKGPEFQKKKHCDMLRNIFKQ